VLKESAHKSLAVASLNVYTEIY